MASAPLCLSGVTGSRSPFHSGRRLTNVPRTFSAPSALSCPCGVMDNTSVFQTDDPGSIPGTGSAGCVGKVSRWPHKPCIRVRVPYPLFRIALCRGIPAGEVCQINGVVAQMEEHLPCKQKAAGSKPVGSISPKYVYWNN